MRSRHSLSALLTHLGCIGLVAASCRDPGGPPAQRARLSAASSTQLTGMVGTAITDVPAVIVRDASGKSAAGVVVTFSIRSGGGAIEPPAVVSSSDGIARLAGWTLGTVPGKNVIAATVDNGDTVVFTADAVAGPPFQLDKIAGDGQIALPGAALGVRPRVRVRDVYGNPVSGVAVTFAVEGGGGSVSPAEAVSDVAGIAESGEWVLGPPGVQRLVARAGQLASEAFTAKATAPPFTCDPVGALPLQTTFRSELTPLSCQSGDGRSGESYTIVVTEANAYVFSATSAEFDTDLELRGAGVEVATNDDLSATTNSAIKALLVPGTYTLSVSSSQVGGGGSYTVSYQPATANVVGCEEAFIVRGVTARGVVEYSDCTLSPNEYSDRFRIYLEAGAQVQVQVRDFSYAGPNVEIDGPDGSTARGGPSGNYLTTLVYSAAVAGYYTVLVGLTGEYDIQYEITVR